VSAHYLLILLGVGCHEQSCSVEESTMSRELWSQMFHTVKLHRNIFHEDNIFCVLVSNSASVDACWATQTISCYPRTCVPLCSAQVLKYPQNPFRLRPSLSFPTMPLSPTAGGTSTRLAMAPASPSTPQCAIGWGVVGVGFLKLVWFFILYSSYTLLIVFILMF
jgi:hypothetical protein